MLDLSKIKTADQAKQAIKETKEAIAKNDKAMKDGSPTGTAKMKAHLEEELQKIKDHMKDQGWK